MLNTNFGSLQHLDFEPVHADNPGELTAYYKIAREDCSNSSTCIIACINFFTEMLSFLRSLQMGIGQSILQAQLQPGYHTRRWNCLASLNHLKVSFLFFLVCLCSAQKMYILIKKLFLEDRWYGNCPWFFWLFWSCRRSSWQG